MNTICRPKTSNYKSSTEFFKIIMSVMCVAMYIIIYSCVEETKIDCIREEDEEERAKECIIIESKNDHTTYLKQNESSQYNAQYQYVSYRVNSISFLITC